MCPDDILATTSPVTWTTTAVDNQDPFPTVSCTPKSPFTFSVGVHQVDCTATDNAGNEAECSFFVTFGKDILKLFNSK